MIEALDDLRPKLRIRRRAGLFLAIVVLLVTVGLTLNADAVFGSDDVRLYLVPGAFGILALFFLNKWVVRSCQNLVMPHLANSIALSYQPQAKHFVDSLPTRLLPRSAIRTLKTW